jgi:hypothetical protein
MSAAKRQAIPVVAQAPLNPPVPISPPPTRSVTDEAFAATRAQIALDDMFAQERELELVNVGGEWSPAQHVRRAA